MISTQKVLFTFLMTVSLFLSGDLQQQVKPEKGVWNPEIKTLWEVDSAGDDIIGGIQDIAVAGDGRVYILDSKNFKIHMYSPEGNHISSFGRRGEGPGEFRNVRMGTQLFVVENRIVFVDRGRLHYFTLSGEFLKTEPIPIQLRPRAFLTTDLFLSAPGTSPDPNNRAVDLKLYHMARKRETVLATYKPFEKAQTTQESRGSQITMAVVIGDITPMMMVAYHRGKVYYGMSDRYHIQVVDLKGNPQFAFGLKDRIPNPVSDAYKEELKQRIGSDAPQEMVERILNGLPERASHFSGIAIDHRGWIYLPVSDPDRRSSTAYDVFSPKGRFMYTAEFGVEEGRNITTSTLGRNRIYIAYEDEEGNVYLSARGIRYPR